ncbi:MAG: hypothetical protein GX177_07965 [Firmicutes bacterium]|nr:hypothetical protein [Bacillota bacterium]
MVNSYGLELVRQLKICLEQNDLVIAAIDGPSGAGKTELAKWLKRKFDANVFHMDDFFLQPHQRTEARLKEVGGNIDYERFKGEVLDRLAADHPFAYQIYDCRQQKLTDWVQVSPKRLNIVEGVYSMHPTLIDRYNFKIFLAVDRETQLERIRRRSGEQLLQRYITEWIPLEERYFQTYNLGEKADFTITTTP